MKPAGGVKWYWGRKGSSYKGERGNSAISRKRQADQRRVNRAMAFTIICATVHYYSLLLNTTGSQPADNESLAKQEHCGNWDTAQDR